MLNQLRIQKVIIDLQKHSSIPLDRIFLVGYGSGGLMAERVNVQLTEAGQHLGGSVVLDGMYGRNKMFDFFHEGTLPKKDMQKAEGYRMSWSVESTAGYSDDDFSHAIRDVSSHMNLHWIRLQPVPFRSSLTQEVQLSPGVNVKVLRPDTLKVEWGTILTHQHDFVQVQFADSPNSDFKTVNISKEWLEGEGRAIYKVIDDSKDTKVKVGIDTVFLRLKSVKPVHGLANHSDINTILENRSFLFEDLKAWMSQRTVSEQQMSLYNKHRPLAITTAKISIFCGAAYMLARMYNDHQFNVPISRYMSNMQNNMRNMQNMPNMVGTLGECLSQFNFLKPNSTDKNE